MNRTFETRLRKIEAEREPPIPLYGTVIVGCDRQEVERKLAEYEAAGTYRPGWPLITITSGVPQASIGPFQRKWADRIPRP